MMIEKNHGCTEEPSVSQRAALFAGIFATLGVNQFSRFANQESCNGDN
jgi:hypothetical protein